MRLFAALLPPEEVVEDLDDFLSVRREHGEFRWAADFHLTLAFLPSVADRHLDELVERLGRAAGRRTRFTARVAGGGAFPNAARARVLWAGLETDEAGRTELDRLATGAKAAAVKSGVTVDGQRFRPHLTLARLGRPQEVTKWVRLLDAYRGPEWDVDALTLVESHLGEGVGGRPRYEVVESFPLGSRIRGA
jgi:2'-5' RNA ligase